jgi:hypothetical protein
MAQIGVLVRPRLETLVQERTEPKLDLQYRRNESHRTYRPITTPHHAELLLSSTTFDSPWVTIARGDPSADHIYFQVLGTPDRLVAEGGGVKGGLRWNWRATALPGDYRATTAGPPWYEVAAYEGDIVTADDARRMIWFALADDLVAMQHQAGMRALFYP